MRFPVKRAALPLVALLLLSAGASAADREAPVAAPTGPAADYPVVVGEPFTIGTTVWTPVDQLNYDAVGNAAIGAGAGVTASHKTLPLPCYIEVTALDTGRTILVRVERRGPMTNDVLVELAPDAAAQLGIAAGGKAPVRVRRVNPPEQERALLRTDGRAPERMSTPEGLLKVLRRKLADQSPLLPTPAAGGATAVKQAPAPSPAPPAAKPVPPVHTSRPASRTLPPKSATTPSPVSPPGAKAAVEPADKLERGSLAVQVATFSSEASARKVAAQLGGAVARAGQYWRVRTGPHANRAQAAAALEKARRAGYSDARILRVD